MCKPHNDKTGLTCKLTQVIHQGQATIDNSARLWIMKKTDENYAKLPIMKNIGDRQQ
jgi:hypothetical protein